ncbi:efflux RND transporter periplasmic adaptor subunit [Thalassobacillus sp. CUG 92003]|uniref:efflux RND transporter periplasmic adaptor subunit n=1 Tax=Thalassobacillus sp. CUG 92003 TaxID=2736641 RepID=UPI0015E6DCBA|nr:efflux RND transporter periplasmic adaptor subunit [Thalassobacillus sp. CUG 92003]
MKKFASLSVMILLIAWLSACSEQSDEEDTTARTTPVETALIAKGDFQVDREIIGRAEAGDTSPVIPETPGELVALSVEQGDRVQKGDPIAEVNPGSRGEDQVELQEIAVRQAQSQLENARTTRQQAEKGLKNAQDQVEAAKQAQEAQQSQSEQAQQAAKAQYEEAQELADEAKKLYEAGDIPEILYNQAQSRADQAQAQYQQAKGQGASTESPVQQAEAQVASAEEQLNQAENGVEQAELQLEQTRVQLEQAQSQAANNTLTAPTAGEVANVEAGTGDMVSNQQPIATVVSLNPMTITATLTGEQLNLFEKGQDLEVKVEAREENPTATVQYVSSVPNDTGLYPVEATVDNSDETIKPGMMATFLLPEKVVENTLIVPTEAIVQEDNQSYLFQVEEDAVKRVDIEVLSSQSDRSAIEADLPEGAEIVTTGQLTLNDGGKITVIEEDA